MNKKKQLLTLILFIPFLAATDIDYMNDPISAQQRQLQEQKSTVPCLMQGTYFRLPGQEIGVTYTLSKGRLGDNLIALFHAKWVSYTHNIPLLYMPFQYSNLLKLHEYEIPLQIVPHGYFCKNITLHTFDSNTALEPYTLYTIPYFPESTIEQELYRWHPNAQTFHIDWDDPGFKQELRKIIAPRYPLQLLPLPPNKLSLAVHVRKTSNGFDGQLSFDLPEEQRSARYVDNVFPSKFLPNEFYIKQIQRLSALLGHPPIYVFIFTDDANPSAIVDIFKKEVDLDNLEFDCRSNNNHFTNVLEDLFSMVQFDFLIRSDSNFPIVASKIGDYKIEIFPESLVAYENKRKIVPGIKIKMPKNS